MSTSTLTSAVAGYAGAVGRHGHGHPKTLRALSNLAYQQCLRELRDRWPNLESDHRDQLVVAVASGQFE
ncbi:MAG: hypothetical protein LLG14_24815 [Nocardiaceae bacterium]|nr:hypothetical protein [Nocardiaceae bacterium]